MEQLDEVEDEHGHNEDLEDEKRSRRNVRRQEELEDRRSKVSSDRLGLGLVLCSAFQQRKHTLPVFNCIHGLVSDPKRERLGV